MPEHDESAPELTVTGSSVPPGNLLDAVLQTVPGIFYLIDSKQRFRRWNASFEQVTGYSASEIAAMSPLDLFAPEHREEVRGAIRRVFECGEASLEAPLLTRSGQTPVFRYSGQLVDVDGEPLIAGIGVDISEQKAAERASARQTEQFRHVAGQVPGVIYQLRYEPGTGIFSMPYASAKLFEVFGVEHSEVVENAQALFDRIAPEDEARVQRAAEQSRQSLCRFHEQFRMLPPGGQLEHAEWVEVDSSPERDQDGAVTWHGFARLITGRRRMEDELVRLAYEDALTGMPNRTSLQLRLEEQIAEASIVGQELALLHLDLDNFKDINDIWGHGSGDRLLEELAGRLREVVGDRGLVGRLGGDEFLIIVQGESVEGPAARLASALCAAMDSPVSVDDRLLRVTASIGMSLFPKDGETAEDLLRHADAALYRAKEEGPSNWASYTPELTAAAMARRYLETELRGAVDRDEIQVALQPVVDLSSGEVVAYEALARWHHREDGWIDPEQFIALAESRGLVAALGEQVYRKAMRAVARIDATSRLSINVAPVQLKDPQFARRLVRMARDCGLQPARLEVEITERAFMDELADKLEQLESLRRQGIAIAIDDFGTGYSSLAYLRHLPVQRLKIDQVFVRGLASNPKNSAIMKAIVTLARELGFSVTAEGVQSAEELEEVRAHGCDCAQGWHLGRGQLVELEAS
ncbi:putative bifunctional diguanylate cyclase/phosphodiesterase [Wenzhouxiangella marina]|nr:EAL domain-containing protein [Wenzhouxiangella marina]MBB6085914.1 diguanylate cyclase (GGDEF)-like protein/PAS domain S-box-containing protein [Wenzhouxiangella marina]